MTNRVRTIWFVVAASIMTVMLACSGAPPEPEVVEEAPPMAVEPFQLPLGLQNQALVIPSDNPMTPEKIRLGEQLFFDPRLSGTGEMSCETCHVPEQGWTDRLQFSPKFDGSLNTRHTPSLYGAGFYSELYWDGRAQGLEAQILAAWTGQMGGDPEAVATTLSGLDGYQTGFEAAFGGPPTPESIVQALGSFVRTIHAGDTPWDRHPQDPASLAESDIGQGFVVFSEVAQCTLCHLPPLFADTLFHNVGIGMDQENPDLGRGAYLARRAEAAGEPAPPEAETLQGAFKTPTLRGIVHHPPYFHDGRAETLEEAVDLMLAGGIANAHLDEKLQAREITPEQREQLLAFVRALSPEMTEYPRPALP